MLLLRASSGYLRRALRSLHRTGATPTGPSVPSTAAPHDGPFKMYSYTFMRKEWHSNAVLCIALFGQAAFVIGTSGNTYLADDGTPNQVIPVNENEDFLSGLRKIEDGSIVSNPHTVKWRIYTDNGRSLFSKGKLDEAEHFFILALQEAKEGFGERDPHVASSCNNLAEIYRLKKEFAKAEPLYLEAVTILEESFGPEDVRVGAALHNLGQFYLVRRKLEEAQKCYERALKIKGRVLGYVHSDYADSMYHLGTVLHLLGKNKDAEALIQDSIRILEEGGLGESQTCLRRMRFLSQIFLTSNKLAAAENLQRKILHTYELSKGWDSLDTVTAAQNLALTLMSSGSLVEARELMERCLTATKNILGENHVQVAAIMLHLSRIALLSSSSLRKVNVSEAEAELEKAKFLLEVSLRISRVALDHLKENANQVPDNDMSVRNAKNQHNALIILLQSLDVVGLFEAAKLELKSEEADIFAVESELALRECLSIFQQPGIRSLLDSPGIKAQYLSSLKRLLSIVSDSIVTKNGDHITTLQMLRDEVAQVEAALSVIMKQKNSN